MNIIKNIRIGLLVNHIAGLGGQVGLKGTDGVVTEALARGAQPKALLRARRFLQTLHDSLNTELNMDLNKSATPLTIVTAPVTLGAVLFAGEWHNEDQFNVEVISDDSLFIEQGTTAKHMEKAAGLLRDENIDVLFFVGGDGTARNMVDANLGSIPLVGIPAGVKMYSGVFAVSPESAAYILISWLEQKPFSIVPAEVRDIDEQAMRANQVKTQFYGELWTPQLRLMQSMKASLEDSQDVLQQDIASYMAEDFIDESSVFVIGPGSTTLALKNDLNGESSLLGVDVYRGHEQILSDTWAEPILQLLDKQHQASTVYLLITFTAGQGFLLGRGNQQINAALLERIGENNIRVLATQDKLDSLQSRPLLIDTGSAELDARLAGYIQVITGYDENVLYPVKAASDFIE